MTNSKHNNKAIKITQLGVLTYVVPSSINTKSNHEELTQAIDECITKRQSHIVLDLADITHVFSTTLSVLIDIHDKLIRSGGWIKLTNVNTVIKDVLGITGLSQSLPLLEDDNISYSQTISTNNTHNLRLGDVLIKKQLLTDKQVEEAIKLQNKYNKRLGQIIVDKGWLSESLLLQALSEQLNIPYIKIRTGLFDPDVVQAIDQATLRRLNILPLFLVKGTLTIATADPQDIPSFDELSVRLQCKVNPVLALREDILKSVGEAFGSSDATSGIIADVDEDFEVVDQSITGDYDTIDELASGSPIINLVNSIIQRAVATNASDIHIEPTAKSSRIRFRIDGVLYEILAPKPELHPAIVSRLKVMANLDIAERRLPQDGRIQVYTQGRSVDLRFSSLPSMFGEKVVLRVLDAKRSILDIETLGLSAHNMGIFKRLLGISNGLVLVTGPTGSGKTTTLYAALNHLNSIEKNIVTIEDPIEYQLDIINQNQVKSEIGLTFSRILKHVLRQDPDIIMVGEIRERETAEIAVQAALTGHLVFSTLHTNDSVGAITRLIDMGVEPYLLSSALSGVISQRLVRTICPECKTKYAADPSLIKRFHWESEGKVILAKGRGCELCYDSGFKGRRAIHEIIETNTSLQRLIISNPSRDELSDYIHKNNIKMLFDDGIAQVRNGNTTLEEVTRVVSEY